MNMDTDSFVYQIKTKDAYRDIAADGSTRAIILKLEIRIIIIIADLR